jgi:hypothetical protein
MVDLYRRKIAAMVISLAKEDPHLVKEMIARLQESGEIEAGDLAYLERIADKWIAIGRANAVRARV